MSGCDSREELVILTASILYAACPAITSAPIAVEKALEIEGEVKRQRREQERKKLPADFRDHLPSALHYAKERLAEERQERLAAAQPDIITGKTMTDPIVKQALLDLVAVMKDLATFAEELNQRVKKVEDRLDHKNFTFYGKVK
jgi:hypothetical protein